MRVAIFTETFLPKVDGIVVSLCRLLDHLEKHGHEALVFAPEGSPSAYGRYQVISYRSMQVPFYPELNVAPPWVHASFEIKKFKPDLVHLVNPISLGLAGLRVAKRYNYPVLASYHTDVPGFAEHWHLGFLSDSIYRYARWIHNRVELNVCPSKFTRNQLLEHGFERVEIWRGGVDTTLFSPLKRSEEWRRRLTNDQPERPLLLYVGRVSPEKSIDRIHAVLEAYPQARLAIVGDGPSRAHLERRFADTDTVFTGYLKGEDLAAAYAAGDLFVFTGDKETFGNVVVEAMASGLPVIAPNSGGVTDLVVEGYNGRLYDPRVPDGMVEAARDLILDAELARTYGERGRKLAENSTWDITLNELMDLYQKVIGGERLPSDFMWLIWERVPTPLEIRDRIFRHIPD